VSIHTADDHPLFRRKALEKLQAPEQLDQLLTVTSPQAWLVLLGLATILIAAIVWAFVGNVETALEGNGMILPQADNPNRLEAIIYMTIEDSHRVEVGMPVRVSPVSVRSEEYGFLRGEVTAVNRRPATAGEMVAILHNDALVQSLASAGLLVEVHVKLFPDSEEASGYLWTLEEGPPNELQPGITAKGFVITKQERPIEMVLPFEL
jgi:hypothetical protein